MFVVHGGGMLLVGPEGRRKEGVGVRAAAATTLPHLTSPHLDHRTPWGPRFPFEEEK